MLLNKLKLTTAMLLVALSLVAGGTSLTYRAHATEPANPKNDSEKPDQPSKPAGAVHMEIPPPKDQPKPAEAPQEDQPKSAEAPTPKQDQPKSTEAPNENIRQPKDPERVTTEEKKPSALLVGDFGDWPGARQSRVECGAYSFTAARTGNTVLAFNAATREVKAVRLNATKEHPLWVTPVVIESSNDNIVALGVKGKRITRVAVFNVKSGKWTPLDLDRPVDGSVWPMTRFGPDAPAYEIGDILYLFNPKTDAWDRLDLRTIADGKQEPRAMKGR